MIIIGEDLLFKRVFAVLTRMTVYRESSIDALNKDFYSNLIYEKSLFNIPRYKYTNYIDILLYFQ